MNRRPLLRRAFYQAGLYRTWLRTVGADTLTVALFHRVLPDGHPGWREAHPEFTISDSLLQQCFAFFAAHYNLVSLAEVVENRDEGRPLPRRALLITFDDGWADTVEFALPVIRRFDVRPAVFITPDAMRSGALFVADRPSPAGAEKRRTRNELSPRLLSADNSYNNSHICRIGSPHRPAESVQRPQRQKVRA